MGLLLALLAVSGVSTWSHANSLDWPQEFRACGGAAQSPIDLPDICDRNGGVTVDPQQAIEFSGYNVDLPAEKLDLVNTGHTLSLKLRNSDESADNGSPGIHYKGNFFQFSELHFHWAASGEEGSDHTMSGQRHAAEVHMVHYNTKYKRMTNAVWKQDGLLVLGTILKSDHEVNEAIQSILEKVDDVITPHRPTFLRSPLNLASLIPGRPDSFYSYTGSLTTPPCAEPVTWIIFVEKGKISSAQLGQLKRLSGGEDKLRDIMPLNNRNILASSDDHCK